MREKQLAIQVEKKPVIVQKFTRVPTTEDGITKEEEKTKFSWVEIYATFVAAFSFLCIGLLRAYTSPAISSMKANPDIFNSSTLPEKEAISWIASSPPMASFIGTVVSGPLLHVFGRQKSLLLLTLPYIAGWAFIGFASEVWMVITGRILTGFAAGISTAGAQLYVSECVRPKVRGTLGFLPSMMLALGVLVGFAASTIDVEWRALGFIMGSFPTILLFMTLTIPESPPWLIMKGRDHQALQNMEKLRGSSNRDEIEEEINTLKSSLFKDKRKRRASVISVTSQAVVSWGKKVKKFLKMMKQRTIWLPAFLATALMFFQQFAGANVVIYFLSVILTEAEPNFSLNHNQNFTDELLSDPSLSLLNHNVGSVLVALIQFLAFFLSLPLIDRMGRKILLQFSAILMAISLGILGFYFHCNEMGKSAEGNEESFSSLFISSTFTWLPLTSLSLFISAYSIGFGPVPFIIMSEIFPAQARSYLCSLTSFSNHFFLFITIKMFPIMVDLIGASKTFWIFAGTSLLSLPLVIFLLPETKGKSLTEIEREFAKDSERRIEEPESPIVQRLIQRRRSSFAMGMGETVEVD